jgi:hypothetical protein
MRLELIGLGAVLVLAGCQEQRTVILEQQSAAAQAANVAPPPPRPRAVTQQDTSPCRAPAGTGPFEHLPHVVSSASVPMPPRAMAEHVNGCAGVRFRLAPDGSPTDITVMAEYPAGFGFGATASAAIAASRWPAKDDQAWRYMVINMHPGAPNT